MTPIERYQADLARDSFQADDAQRMAVEHFQRLYIDLQQKSHSSNMLGNLFRQKSAVKGLYLWGGTGRGKTYLMDCLYKCLDFEPRKNRIHFHRFMRDIHARLKGLPKTPNPLDVIGRDLASKVRILCLDEFHVSDIGDAMILGGLLRAMFDNGIVLVATSNIAIDDLYLNGLQRERFLYAIKLLKDHTDEVDFGHGLDYRARLLDKNGAYRLRSQGGEDFLEQHLATIAPCPPKRNRHLEINGRTIDYVALADDVVWFDFDVLCASPRSAADYIEIAQQFHTVLLGNVRRMNEDNADIAKRFVHLIDAFYDHSVKLIVTAECAVVDLYQGRMLELAFVRTISRLTEMDSPEYFRQAHSPGTVRKSDG